MKPLRGPIRRVLVISLGGAGDCLMAMPLIRELKTHWPDAAIDVLVMQGKVARDVVTDHPGVHECLLHDFMRASRMSAVAYCLTLRRRRYDVSFTVMPQNRIEYNVITWLIGARRRLGFQYAISCGAFGWFFLTDRIAEDTRAHLIDNNRRLAREGLGLPAPAEAPTLTLPLGPDVRAFAERVMRERGLEGKGLIGMHPGTGLTKNLALRRWSPAKWARLAQMLAAKTDSVILLFGSPDEAPLRAEIRGLAALAADRLQDAPEGTILETAAFLQRMDCLVCCDTLLTHVAAAVGTPEVVIMGPTPHTSVYPYGVPHRIVRLGLSCSPCYGYSRHDIRCTHPQPMACLVTLEPELVCDAVESLLHTTSQIRAVLDR